MKTLFLSIIIGLLALSPAFAERNDRVFIEPQQLDEAFAYVSDIMGKDIYTTGGRDVPGSVTEEPDEWENVGTVDDIILSREGEVKAVLVDVGGFLGMGARTIAIDMETMEFVHREGEDDFYLAIPASREQLENAPEYSEDQHRREGYQRDRQSPDHMGGEGQPRVDTAPRPTDPGTTQDTQERQQDQYQDRDQHANDRPVHEGFSRVSPRTMTADDLQNADVYDVNNENIANVDEVLISPEGEVEGVVVNVGGFLGFGGRSVALDIDQIDIQRDGDDDLRVYIPMTEQELRNQPEYQRNN
ncbi:PRC-barrel domain-containing protein [Desulfonatronum thiosulfatophilum]|uniref:PRC-barrel domain-containing protein n=1 Tax=Desulfonatronum thiosulfatophilum TaxID=617002 RepID=A0A1G6CKM0_9BACT|nr:PRC-barrel domain-containing protein [Desulfonatronum thiosulfatophilum]SDB33410.1 PRC-barrel domain-containing protein [Desulfonatronum thiosulfatophilum]